MYLSTTKTLTLFALASLSAAQSATVVIEASHGGAGSDLTNTTITVPLNTIYTDSALQVVSTLFLVDATGIAVNSITCTPYRFANGTGTDGLPFTFTTPSLLSTNTVQVGSLFCKSSPGSTTSSRTVTPSGMITPSSNLTLSLLSSTTSSTSSVTAVVVTITPSSNGDGPPITVTSFVNGGSPSTVTTSTSSQPTSATPSPQLGSAGEQLVTQARGWIVCTVLLVVTILFATHL